MAANQIQPQSEQYLPLNPPLSKSNQQQTVTHQRRILFRHPAYPSTAPALLSLLAVDGGSGIGIHYQTAIVACGIVAGNRFQDAWFGQKIMNNNGNDADSFIRCDEPLDGILRDDEYYFFVSTTGSQDEKYPVVPSFDHWRFPHDAIPELWAELRTTLCSNNILELDPLSLQWNTRVISRDRTCRITGYQEGLNAAHLVPRDKAIWFMDNKMKQYCEQYESILGVDDASNALLLRSDLHYHFDRRRIALVPKKSKRTGAGEQTTRLVVHQMLQTSSRELYHLYHNHTTQPLTRGITIQSLLARFAWTVLCDENYCFLKGSQKYAVMIWKPEDAKISIEMLSQQVIAKLGRLFPPPATKSRSVSPRKRRQEEEETDSDNEPGWEIECQDADLIEDEDDDSDERRGRTRTRGYYSNDFLHQRGSLSTLSPSPLETPSSNGSFCDFVQRDREGSVKKLLSLKRRRLGIDS
ncbi:MAG: hypothetical protein Q9160_008781 [Pyrenula sp. 1 TL-2023]